jgi:hypothetical protein
MKFFRILGIVIGTLALSAIIISFAIQGTQTIFSFLSESKNTLSNSETAKILDDKSLLSRSEPYIGKIIIEDLELRKLAASIVQDCPSNDKECQVNKVFRYIVENYNYYSDPRASELIQGPFDTIKVKGGDCEDLTIFMNSLLENIGLKTYIILTDNHAYGLVCGVDPQKLLTYVNQGLFENFAKQSKIDDGEIVYEDGNVYLKQEYIKKFVLNPNQIQYFGGDGSPIKEPFITKGFSYKYSFSSPVNFYVIAGEDEYDNAVKGESFQAFKCTEESTLSVEGTCDNIATDGGIMITNKDINNVVVIQDLEIFYLYSENSLISNITITSYNLDNSNCVVLDGTSGKYGYVGYNPQDVTGIKVAVDPVTKQIVHLT